MWHCKSLPASNRPHSVSPATNLRLSLATMQTPRRLQSHASRTLTSLVRLADHSADWHCAEPELWCSDEDANPYTYLANGWVDGEQDLKYHPGESLPWTKYLSDV